METLSVIALICIYLWLDLHPFETPPPAPVPYDPQLN